MRATGIPARHMRHIPVMMTIVSPSIRKIHRIRSESYFGPGGGPALKLSWDSCSPYLRYSTDGLCDGASSLNVSQETLHRHRFIFKTKRRTGSRTVIIGDKGFLLAIFRLRSSFH
ncbi:hypothetical protein SRHO_G00280940 [Serrasalmus rhombeus]